MNSEEWRKIPDFPAYSISNHGRVRRDVGGGGAVPGRILKFNITTSGYRCVHLWRDSKRHPRSVHRLVASVFLSKAEDGHTEVAHYDGDRLNNHVSNLRWTDRGGNMADRVRHGTSPIGSRNAMAKLKETDVQIIKRLLRVGFQPATIADQFGVHRGTIEFILRGKTWKHVA
jgi:hypothetical protein